MLNRLWFGILTLEQYRCPSGRRGRPSSKVSGFETRSCARIQFVPERHKGSMSFEHLRNQGGWCRHALWSLIRIGSSPAWNRTFPSKWQKYSIARGDRILRSSEYSSNCDIRNYSYLGFSSLSVERPLMCNLIRSLNNG